MIENDEKMMRKMMGKWWATDGTYGKMTGKWRDIWTLIGTIMEQYVKIIGKKMEKWKHMENDRVVKCYPGNRWKWSKQLFSKKTVKKKCTRTCAQTRIVKMICTRTCAQTTIVKMICTRTCAQTKTVKKNCTRTCAQTKTVKKMYQILCPHIWSNMSLCLATAYIYICRSYRS